MQDEILILSYALVIKGFKGSHLHYPTTVLDYASCVIKRTFWFCLAVNIC